MLLSLSVTHVVTGQLESFRRASCPFVFATKSRRALASREIFARGSTCCGFTSDAAALIQRGRVLRAGEDIPEAELSS
jgi:hypothetical protein